MAEAGPPGDDAIPPDLAPFLPGTTAETWTKVAPIVPASAYLAGGTGLTVHLHHRVSRDLDFMLERDEDLERLREVLEEVGRLGVTHQDEGTLNGMLDRTKIQFLRATDQKVLRRATIVAGIRVASVEDILAMKLKVIMDGGEMRDYFDLMEIDRGAIRVEEGIALLLEKYRPREADRTVAAVVRSLAYLDDVADDPALPVGRGAIQDYWTQRQREVVENLSRG
jgi:hypothetical protein